MLQLLLSPKKILYFVLIAALLFGIWTGVSFVRDKNAAEAAVEKLTQTVAVLELQSAQKEAAARIADTAHNVLEKFKNGYTDVRIGIAQSSEKDDGPVAPVLRRTLDSLDSLRP